MLWGETSIRQFRVNCGHAKRIDRISDSVAASELCRQVPVRVRAQPRVSDTKFTLPLSRASRGNDHALVLLENGPVTIDNGITCLFAVTVRGGSVIWLGKHEGLAHTRIVIPAFVSFQNGKMHWFIAT
jgi:hypothetical protein